MAETLCAACNDKIWIEEADEEVYYISTITAPGNQIQNGAGVCEACFLEGLCHRCGTILDSPGAYWTCIGCKRRIGLGECDCAAVGWCQCVDVICRECILLQPEDEWRCETCGLDMRTMLQQGPGITPDDSGMKCYTCAKELE